MVSVVPYTSSREGAWNGFVQNAKNGMFLFDRRYMEYHSDRFVDYSMMFFDGEKLVGVMPANVDGPRVISHGGLTFGGVVCDRKMTVVKMLEVFEVLTEKLKSDGIETLIYKAVPHLFHDVPADEDLYALYRCGAKLMKREPSAAIDLRERLPFNKLRKRCINKARKHGVQLGLSEDYEAFMEMMAALLKSKYNVEPTHTAREMKLLAGRFPENIKLFTASQEEQIVAGVIIYESKNVAHVQYRASSDKGDELHALDCILSHLITEHYADKRYFDFGISTESEGLYLNVGLAENKESFGARTIVFDTYQLDLA